MSALLEVPAVRERVHPLTVKDYHQLGESGALSEKVEFLRGIIVTKVSKSPLLEFVAQQLMKALWAKLPPGFELRPERPLTLRDSEPEPDISIVEGKPEDWLRKHPSTAHLVIEISISTVELDREKGAIYAEAGILEYWMVRAAEKVVDVHRGPGPSGYAKIMTVRQGEMLECGSIPGLGVELAEIFPKE